MKKQGVKTTYKINVIGCQTPFQDVKYLELYG